jgi:hypothetical protein
MQLDSDAILLHTSPSNLDIACDLKVAPQAFTLLNQALQFMQYGKQ